MAEGLNIPEDLKEVYNRLIYKIQPDLREDENFLKTVIACLKFGGERLASHCIEITNINFEEQINFIRRRLQEKMREEGENGEEIEKDSKDEDEYDKNEDDMEDDDDKEEESDDDGDKVIDDIID